MSDHGPCGCDESKALKARVAELEDQAKYPARNLEIKLTDLQTYDAGAAAERAAIVAYLRALPYGIDAGAVAAEFVESLAHLAHAESEK